MAANSAIEWTDATFNPWEGCARVSPGCQHCYAEARAARYDSSKWGPQGTRVVRSEAYWRGPVKWNRMAVEGKLPDGSANPDGHRPRVFCASLADVFEEWSGPMSAASGQQLFWPHNSIDTPMWIPDGDCGGGEPAVTMGDVRSRLFRLIADTPALDWLLVTKRPEHAATAFPFHCGGAVGSRSRDGLPIDHLMTGGAYLPNVWLGTSVEDRKHGMPRIGILRTIPAAVRFLSVEPLLEDLGALDLNGIGWVIVGGESGPGARLLNVEWVRSIVRQCRDVGVPVFVKQLGANPAITYGELSRIRSNPPVVDCHPGTLDRFPLKDKKGGDIAEFPPDLRIREFPTTTEVTR